MRGLNALSSGVKSIKGEVVASYCSAHSVSLFGLLETNVSSGREEEVKRSLPVNWDHITNSHLDGSGRIWIMWNPAVFFVSL